MENQSNQATKKGLILLLGIIVGLLTGVLVTVVMFNKLNNRSQKSDEVAQPAPDKSASDTIYKYMLPGDYLAMRMTLSPVRHPIVYRMIRLLLMNPRWTTCLTRKNL